MKNPPRASKIEKNLLSMKPFRKNHLNKNAAFDGCMFETHGEEYETVKRAREKDPDQIATLIDSDGATWIARGMHWVNRMGFLIGKRKLPPFEEFIFTEPHKNRAGFPRLRCRARNNKLQNFRPTPPSLEYHAK